MAKRGGGQRQHSKVVWPGFSNAPLPRNVKKVGRNELCPCDSGKKYKDCHEKDGEAFLHKLAVEEEKIRLTALRKEMKAKGVPWYKRFFFRM
jgi:hypothetical protein